MRVDEIMTTHVRTVREVDSIDRVTAVLADNDITAVPVLDRDGAVIGMISDGDLLRRRSTVPAETASGTAGSAMSKPVISVSPRTAVAEVAETLLRHRINELPVIEGNHLVGIISRHDLLRLLTASEANLRREIQHRLDRYAGGHRWTVQIADRIAYITGDFHDESERHTVSMLAATVQGVHDVQLRTAPGERIDCG